MSVTLGESLTISVLSVVARSRAHDFRGQIRIAGERLAFARDVRTRDVDFDRVDLVARGKPLADVGIIVDAKARDAADDRARTAREFCDFVLEIPLDARDSASRSR